MFRHFKKCSLEFAYSLFHCCTPSFPKDSLLTNDYLLQVLTYTQQGDRKKVDSINKKHPHGTHNQLSWRTNRAILHAVLKDKDSMYYYLEQSQFDDHV